MGEVVQAGRGRQAMPCTALAPLGFWGLGLSVADPGRTNGIEPEGRLDKAKPAWKRTRNFATIALSRACSFKPSQASLLTCQGRAEAGPAPCVLGMGMRGACGFLDGAGTKDKDRQVVSSE